MTLLPKEAAMTTIPHPRPRPRSLALVVTLALAVLALVAPARASTPATESCSVTWGSLPKGGTPAPVPAATVAAVRAGTHACYDRLVVDVAGTPAFSSWSARYVDAVTADPSGQPVPLRGGAFLQISLGAGGSLTTPSRQLADVTGYPTFRQVAGAGAFEGVSSIGLGVRARLPFRVLTLTGIPGSANGTRVVIDVAHHW